MPSRPSSAARPSPRPASGDPRGEHKRRASGHRFSDAEIEALSRRTIPRRYNQEKVDTALERQGLDGLDGQSSGRSSSVPALRREPLRDGGNRITASSSKRRPQLAAHTRPGGPIRPVSRPMSSMDAVGGMRAGSNFPPGKHLVPLEDSDDEAALPDPLVVRTTLGSSLAGCQVRSSSVAVLERATVKAAIAQLIPARGRSASPRQEYENRGGEDVIRTPSKGSMTSDTPSGSGLPCMRRRRASATAAGNRRNLSSVDELGFPPKALKQLRNKLLGKHRSLHDVFSQLQPDNDMDKPMIKPELHFCLKQVILDGADEFFVAVEEVYPKANVTLNLLHKLLVLSIRPEGPMWELRSRLMDFGLWPHDVPTAQDLVRRFLRTKVGFKDKGNNAKDRSTKDHGISEFPLAVPINSGDHMYFLGLSDWLRFCGIIGLALFEAREVFHLLADGSESLSLYSMFETVQGTVTPHTSLMSLAERALHQYGSLREAFQAASWNLESKMDATQFRQFTKSLNYEERPSDLLWGVMITGSRMADPRIVEDDFVRKLLRWAPNAAMASLKSQLIELHGSLVEAKRALRRHGMPGSVPLTPRKFRRVLLAAGITRSDTDVVLSKVMMARLRDLGTLKAGDEEVTLDDVFDRLRGASLLPKMGFGNVEEFVKHETAPLWNQVREVEKQLEAISERRLPGGGLHPSSLPGGGSSADLMAPSAMPKHAVLKDTSVTNLPGEEDALRTGKDLSPLPAVGILKGAY